MALNPYAKRATNTYQLAQASTTDQVSLVILLYEGAIRFLKLANKRLEERNIEGAYQNIALAKNIISELIASLDLNEKNQEIGQSLKQLYNYMFVRLLEANIFKDATRVNEVIHLLSNLLDGWKAISKRTKTPGAPTLSAQAPKLTSVYG